MPAGLHGIPSFEAAEVGRLAGKCLDSPYQCDATILSKQGKAPGWAAAVRAFEDQFFSQREPYFAA